ncbi:MULTISPECIES: polyprenyl diphosphate synthase [Pseudothermotoga]|uniref:Isoprenyl transferase n=1 Tax=Pseudothermotoga lettingae (strain ATCC BAA-301 / DSM 14385 / NBRC 107922 / TMO) TaxID=416591 RepID=A8F864_PSELT|nr:MULTISPECIES: polyprenyl diphosphate synthase [Pseudothermotoga]ABV34348.1 undecaprenyl diphosphate synthase [Pseudothermotoga lettingae TMO]KUK20098.1 MAG: Isoprenyl transferase [Pseudothermotoga lettingae]MDI3494904.1 undecaprenyl diphosphate synthase [Pseudothermotoga sp.]MDK2885049.1 undecaprenyl diphosphate synthase [Pseudothermotoga sp.]GLI48707.1 isoprenyl transferase [Pseudothermotoga lettingae TMO]
MITHLAFIMDGNGRWAQKKGLPRAEGHRRGAQKAEKVVEWCAELGIKYVTLYTFSTENWKRPKEEINYLFLLLVNTIKRKFNHMMKQGVRLRFCGVIDELPKQIADICREFEEKTKHNDKIQVILALNYGGRRELIDAFNRAIKAGVKSLSEDDFKQFLYLPDVPDPDFVIRTSGEIRISNFLLWQTAYSELYFTKTLWPDFARSDLLRALDDFNKRHRKFGGL